MSEKDIMKRIRSLAKSRDHYNSILLKLVFLKKDNYKKYCEVMLRFENSTSNDLTLLEIL